MGAITFTPGSASVAGSVSISATTSNGTVTNVESLTAITIPAGALWVVIENAGLVESGDAAATGTVEGADWTVGRKERFEAVYDPNAGDFVKLPEINITCNGSRFRVSYFS